jgi:hypothetical protein
MRRCSACLVDVADEAPRCPKCLRQSTLKSPRHLEEQDPSAAQRPRFPAAGFAAFAAVGWLFILAVVTYVDEERWLVEHRAAATGMRVLTGLLLFAVYGGARSLGTWRALAATIGAVAGAAAVAALVFAAAAGLNLLGAVGTPVCWGLALALTVGAALGASRWLRDR